MKPQHLIPALFVLGLGVGCASGPVIGTHPTPAGDTLLERSQTYPPQWVHSALPDDPNSRYYRGQGEDRKREDARDKAIIEILKNYSLDLGTDFQSLTRLHEEEIQRPHSDIYTRTGRAITDAEIVARICSRGLELKDEYWEKRSRGNDYTFYRYWILGRIESRLVDEERRRIDSLRRAELPPPPPPNSSLNLTLQRDKTECHPGDTLRITLEANEDCYLYYLNLSGGRWLLQHQGRLSRGTPLTLELCAEYGGSPFERLRFIASSRELDVDAALRRVYPADVLEDLRRQAQAKGAHYHEQEVSIIIQPGR